MSQKDEKDFTNWGDYLGDNDEIDDSLQEMKESDIVQVEGELVPRNKAKGLLKNGVNTTVGTITNIYGKAYNSVTNILDRIMNSSDKTNSEVLDLFKTTIKGYQRTIEIEQAKDNPDPEIIRNTQDSIDKIVKETSVKHDKVHQHNETVLTVVLGAVVFITSKGLEMLLDSKNKKY